MIQGRDSKGNFIKGNVPGNKRADSSPPASAGRDSKGHFIKGNVPLNKRADSSPPASAGRDSKGHFIKSNVPGNKRADSSPPAIAGSPPAIAGRMLIGGGAVKTDCVQVTCPACRQQVEAIARNGRVQGYCAVARRYVDFRVKT